ncbi:hypothetical protein [Mammaliicoccus vitulinus]|uniref:hypothetical protein n=1 Tax=Mammaliicoccus vitulinus TaxID=71237 RepID=UPI003BA0B96D
MKNIILVVFLFCLTIFSAYYMTVTDSKPDNKKDAKQEKTEQSKKSSKDEDLNIKTQKDLEKVINSKKDEQTKMNAYNQAVNKNIVPRSEHYQNAEAAYEESVKLKNGKNEK